MATTAPSRLRLAAALLVPAVGQGTGTAALLIGCAAPYAALRSPADGSAAAGYSHAGEPALVLAAGAGAWCALTWLCGATLLAVLAAARASRSLDPLPRGARARPQQRDASRLPHRVGSRLPQRVAAVLVGVTVVGGPLAAGGATATAGGERTALGVHAGQRAGDAVADRDAVLVGRWSPDRPAAPAAPARAVSAPDGRNDPVVVRRGDSLWLICARALGPGATAADIAAAWPRWYAANRATVGPDPDVLLPGQVLHHPT